MINASGAASIGFADVLDSPAAIDQVVWQDRRMSLPEFMAVADADFATTSCVNWCAARTTFAPHGG